MAQRYFVDHLPEPGPFELEGELAHHIGHVLRSRPGDEICIADGRGRSARAGIVAVARRSVTLEVAAVSYREPPPRKVQLAFPLPRRNRAEWLFEHGTEVGVTVFWPLLTTRSRSAGERPERWDRIVRAAAGQCDRDWLPETRATLELLDFVRRRDLPAQRFLADPAGEPLPAITADDTMMLVGPEGGFTAEERAAAIAADFRPCRLGPHILRTETAALVGAARLVI